MSYGEYASAWGRVCTQGCRGLLLLLLGCQPALLPAEEAMELEGMAVIGNQELPKALFIVPWKDAESAMALERPLNTLVNEALQPVDPDVFRRKIEYFDTVHNKP